MQTLRTPLALLAFLILITGTGCNPEEAPAGKLDAAAAEWLTDYPAALARAKAENKRVFLDFTGSDWCSACKLIKKKVLATGEFAAYAKDSLILVEIDFPMNKPQPDSLVKANKALAEKLKIDGYPTLVVVDAEGKELWREEGYDDETPAQYIAKLKAIQAK